MEIYMKRLVVLALMLIGCGGIDVGADPIEAPPLNAAAPPGCFCIVLDEEHAEKYYRFAKEATGEEYAWGTLDEVQRAKWITAVESFVGANQGEIVLP